MIFGSVCSGIEAASVAWEPLGWRAAFLSEIEPFPRAVLAHRWPHVPLRGDFTQIKADDHEPIDLLVGGTPCQSFSVAGLRGGMADARGNLALEYLRLADRLRPRWLVWENVPGVLSSSGGRDFGAFLGGLAELGYGFAYRVLDAQHFGVPQRRRRVFVVGHLGDWRHAAAVLFEPASMRGDTAPRKGTGQTAGTLLGTGVGTSGADDNQARAGHIGACCLTGHASRSDGETENFVPVCFGAQMSTPHWQHDQADTLQAKNPKAVALGVGVRCLTPVECERLQGFPDNHTLVPYRGKPAADGPRYKALGNSMAVPVMRWIGERIASVEAQAMQVAA